MNLTAEIAENAEQEKAEPRIHTDNTDFLLLLLIRVIREDPW